MKLVKLTAVKVDAETQQKIERNVYVNPKTVCWLGPYEKGSKLFFPNGSFLTLVDAPYLVASRLS